MQLTAVQRLRIIYSIDGPLSYASVLDIGRLWERLLHRAHITLAFTQGFNPHPRMQFAAALPVGYTSIFEVLDIWLNREYDPGQVLQQTRLQCPPGLSISSVQNVPFNAPSPQATLTQMDFTILVDSQVTEATMKSQIRTLLDSHTFMFERTRKGQSRLFDLRPLVRDLCYLESSDQGHILELELAARAEGSIRPEEVIRALQIPYKRLRIHRTGLQWQESMV